jgi:hypothetical protein
MVLKLRIETFHAHYYLVVVVFDSELAVIAVDIN